MRVLKHDIWLHARPWNNALSKALQNPPTNAVKTSISAILKSHTNFLYKLSAAVNLYLLHTAGTGPVLVVELHCCIARYSHVTVSLVLIARFNKSLRPSATHVEVLQPALRPQNSPNLSVSVGFRNCILSSYMGLVCLQICSVCAALILGAWNGPSLRA